MNTKTELFNDKCASSDAKLEFTLELYNKGPCSNEEKLINGLPKEIEDLWIHVTIKNLEDHEIVLQSCTDSFKITDRNQEVVFTHPIPAVKPKDVTIEIGENVIEYPLTCTCNAEIIGGLFKAPYKITYVLGPYEIKFDLPLDSTGLVNKKVTFKDFNCTKTEGCITKDKAKLTAGNTTLFEGKMNNGWVKHLGKEGDANKVDPITFVDTLEIKLIDQDCVDSDDTLGTHNLGDEQNNAAGDQTMTFTKYGADYSLSYFLEIYPKPL